MAKSIKPAIIVLDVLMPGQNGIETCKKLREQRESEEIPVIMLTAVNEPEQRIKAFNAGADDYSLEPNRVEIRQLLAEALASSGNHAESDTQFEIILKQSPEFEPAMRSWSALLGQRKKVEVLGATLKIFSKNNPNNVWCAVELSKLLWFVGDREGALEQMEAIAKESKSNLAKFYYAYFLDLSAKYEKTRSVLSEVREIALETEFHLALSFFKENKLPEAIQHWLKVPVESPLYFKAQVNAALAFEQQSNFEKAKELLNALTPPTEYKKNVEKKLISLITSEERKPATSSSDELSYFINWNTPPL